VVRAGAATAAESDGEETEEVSNMEQAAVVGMSIEEGQLMLREREIEER